MSDSIPEDGAGRAEIAVSRPPVELRRSGQTHGDFPVPEAL